MVQGIGGRVSGLVRTTPSPILIERIGKERVLEPETARIDQIAGAKNAIEMGYKNIAVPVAKGSRAKKCTELEKSTA